MNELKAVWITDYDHRTDKLYKRPGCPECQAPVGSLGGKIRCYSCGKEYELDNNMKSWTDKRQTTKTEWLDCIGCGGKKCVETIYTRNPVTLEWQVTYGKCIKCGAEFIV